MKDLNNCLYEMANIMSLDELNICRKEFANMHYENAKQIGSKSFYNLMGKVVTEKQFSDIANACESGGEVVFEYCRCDYKTIQKTMSKYGFLIYEHLNSLEISQMFGLYNIPPNVNFVLAVKKEHIKMG